MVAVDSEKLFAGFYRSVGDGPKVADFDSVIGSVAAEAVKQFEDVAGVDHDGN